MATKSKTKSRTSKSKLNKKVGIPHWVIVVVALIIAGVGIFLVYNSFASGQRNYVSGRDVTCGNGYCYVNVVNGVGHGNQGNRTCYPSHNQYGYYCYTGSTKPHL